MQLHVDAATNSFFRTDGGSFLDDHFAEPRRVYAVGFADPTNNKRYTIVDVTDDRIFVEEDLTVSETGDGDEFLVIPGDRGPLVDIFLDLQIVLEETLEELGGTPAQSFDDLAAQMIAMQELLLDSNPANDPTQAEVEALGAELARAYLNNWIGEIDTGIRNWGSFGLATTNAFLDPGATRFHQNNGARNEGPDVDRGEAEAIGILDVIVSELHDPNHDGSVADSFILNHLAPMLGIPKFAAQVGGALIDFGTLLDDLVFGPLGLVLSPVRGILGEVKDLVKDFIEDAIEDRFGVDMDQVDLLTSLANKMDLAAIYVGDARIEIFKSGDHEKLDRYLGIEGIGQNAPLSPAIQNIPGLEFYPGAVGERQNDNVEFDKTKFKAYADAVTMSKMLLLQETDPLGVGTVGDGQLSKLMSDGLTAVANNGMPGPVVPYDWGLLNNNGGHGGNILTTTLPMPGVPLEVDVQRLDPDGFLLSHYLVDMFSDERPWLRLIDGDLPWRQNTFTTTSAQFRINSQDDVLPKATNGLAHYTSSVAPGQYAIQATWLFNVTQEMFVTEEGPDRKLTRRQFQRAASNVKYYVYDDATPGDLTDDTPIAVFTIDQRRHATGFIDGDSVEFQTLGGAGSVVNITTGNLRVEISNDADGDVSAGPIRVDPVDPSAAAFRIAVGRDANMDVVPGAYSETGVGWTDSVYTVGSGNFPLWESNMLRPVFRFFYEDWVNGDLDFPDLGDATSMDPNLNPAIVPDATTGPNLSPFSPAPVNAAATPNVLTVNGAQAIDFGAADLIFTGIVGNGAGGADNITITTTGTVRIAGNAGGGGLTNITINAKRIEIDAGVVISTRQIAGLDPLSSASTGDSGNLVLSAEQIIVGAGAALVADAPGFNAGDVTLTATSNAANDFVLDQNGFRLIGPDARVDLAHDSLIRGFDVTITASATTTTAATGQDAIAEFAAGLSLVLAKLATVAAILAAHPYIPNQYRDEIETASEALGDGADAVGGVTEDGLIGVEPDRIKAVFAQSRAEVTLAMGARIEASRDVTIDAHAESTAAQTAAGEDFGFAYASSAPTARVDIATGAILLAARDVTLTATTANALAIRAEVFTDEGIAAIAISLARVRSSSSVVVHHGAQIGGEPGLYGALPGTLAATPIRNLRISADNVVAVANVAISSGFADSGLAGGGAGLAIGTYFSSALASLAATVRATGDVLVEAGSHDDMSVTRSFSDVAAAPGPSDVVAAINRFLDELDFSIEIAGQTISAGDIEIGELGLTIGAAITSVEAENKAAALIDDGADIVVGGDVTVRALAEAAPRLSASSVAAGAPTVGIGGAIAWSHLANQASAFIGYNAIVDSPHQILIEADAVFDDDVAGFDPGIDLTDSDSATGTDRIGEEWSDANEVAGNVAAALAPVVGHLGLLLAGAFGTSYVHTAANGGTGGVGGGMSYVDIYNMAAAGIAGGSLINTRFTGDIDQDVIVDAHADADVTNVAGLDSPLSAGGVPTAGGIGVGGYFGAVLLDNYARAYIDDRALVIAERDLRLESLVDTAILNIVQGGREAADVAVDGAFALVILGVESLAFIEDRADAHATRVVLHAEDQSVVVNVAGGMASAPEVSVGLAAAFTIVAQPRSLEDRAPIAPGEDVPNTSAFDSFETFIDTLSAIADDVVTGISEGDVLGGSRTAAFIGDAALQMGELGTGGEEGEVRAESQILIDADSQYEVWTLAIAGSTSAQPNTFFGGGSQSGGIGFGLGISGDVAFNSIEKTTETYLRDNGLIRSPIVRLEATDESLAAASAGALAFGSHIGLGGAFARNGFFSKTRSFTQDSAIETFDLDILALATPTVLSFADGGAGTRNTIALAGSATKTDVVNIGEAAIGDRTHADVDGLVEVHAVAELDGLADAGAGSEGNNGFLSIGIALNIGNMVNDARAFIGTNALVDALTDVIIRAEADEDVLTIAAAYSTIGDGEYNQVFINGGGATPLAGPGEAIGSDPLLTTSMAMADLDGDGDMDLVVGSFAQSARRYLNDGDGEFGDSLALGGNLIDAATSFDPARIASSVTPPLTLAVTTGDVDGDGDIDIITGNSSGPNKVFYNLTDEVDDLPLPEFVKDLFKGDFETGDGHEIGRSVLLGTLASAPGAGNTSVDQLVTQVQAAIDALLVAEGLPLGTITAARGPVDGSGRVSVALTAPDRVLRADKFTAALNAARIDGRTDLGFTFVLRAIKDQGLPGEQVFDLNVGIATDPLLIHGTHNNTTPNELVADIQGVLDTVLVANGLAAGDVRVGLDDKGAITFAGVNVELDQVMLDNAVADVAQRRVDGALKDTPDPADDQIEVQLSLGDADPTTAAVAIDLNGDGLVDLVAGNLGTPNRAYINDGGARLQTTGDAAIEFTVKVASEAAILAALEAGSDIFEVLKLIKPVTIKLDPKVTADNLTPADLLADIQVALDSALVAAGFAAGDIVAGLDAKNKIRLVARDGIGVEDLEDGEEALQAGRAYFKIGRNIGDEKDFTTSIALGDLNNDLRPDLVVGNIGIDLSKMLKRGFITIRDFTAGLVIGLADLAASGLTSLVELIQSGLVDRFGFDPTDPVLIGDLIDSGLTELDDLTRRGVVTAEDFAAGTQVQVDGAGGLIESGLVTAQELQDAGLPTTGSVALDDLLASGLVSLEDLAGEALVGAEDLIAGTTTSLGALLDSGLVEAEELANQGLVDLDNLLFDTLDLDDLVESGLVSLQELIDENLLDRFDLADLDLPPPAFLDEFAIGGPSRVYLNNGDGTFGAPADLDSRITRSVALGDIDQDGDLDIATGNIGAGSLSPTRMYTNDGVHGGTFTSPGRDVGDGALTMAIALADVTGDGAADLITGNAFSGNRLYANNNDGSGNFGPAQGVGTSQFATTSLAVEDVDGDGRMDVLAGSSLPSLAVAASLSLVTVDDRASAHVDPGAAVISGGSIFIDATGETDVLSLVGAAALAGDVSVGAALGGTEIKRDVRAYIDGATVIALGTNTAGPRGVFVTARAEDFMLGFAGGAGLTEDVGVMASAVLNRMDSSTQAYITGQALVSTGGLDNARRDVVVSAEHETVTIGVAGSLTGAVGATVGAAGDIELLKKSVKAWVGPGAIVLSPDDVVIDAYTEDTMLSLVAGIGGAIGLAIAGSVALLSMDVTTQAFVDGGTVAAQGNVVIQSHSEFDANALVGAAALGFAGGIGASAAIVLHADHTEAFITGHTETDEEGNVTLTPANVTARGLRDTATVRTEETGSLPDPLDFDPIYDTREIRGVALTATSDEDVDLLSVAGSASLLLGIAAAVTFVGLAETTRAYTDTGSVVQRFTDGALHPDLTTTLFAFDYTNTLGIAGAVTGAIGGAVGAGVDGAAIAKSTEAFVNGAVGAQEAGDLITNREVEIKALSIENADSFAAGAPLAVILAVSGSVSALAFDLDTRAYAGSDASIHANGNVVIFADDLVQVNTINGSATAAGGAAIGAAAGAVVIERETEAFSEAGAEITALGQVDGLSAPNGTLEECLAVSCLVEDSVDAIFGDGAFDAFVAAVTFLVDNPITQALDDILGVVFTVLVTPVSLPDFTGLLKVVRHVRPAYSPLRGVAIVATGRDDVETLAVGASVSGLAAIEASAGVLITTSTTRATAGGSINADLSQVHQDQRIVVGAASDTQHIAISGVAAGSAVAAVGAGANLTLIGNFTIAAIGEGATVRSNTSIDVLASGSEQVLSIAAGAAASVGLSIPIAASVPLISINTHTYAVIDANADVIAQHNVNVRAFDDSNLNTIAGAGALGTGFATIGVGASVSAVIVNKDTQAWIGRNAMVDAQARGGAVPVFAGHVDGAEITGAPELVTQNVRGVSVQAFSRERVLPIAAAGAASSSLISLTVAGAINFNFVDSDTAAFIDEGAKVNTRPTGSTADGQTVVVTSANEVHTFGIAATFNTSSVAIGGGIDMAIIRNDGVASIRSGAEVMARGDIQVNAVSAIETDSFVAGAGETDGLVGLVASFSMTGVREKFKFSIFGAEIFDFANEFDTAESLQEFIDGSLVGARDSLKAQVEGAGMVGAGDGVSRALAFSAPETPAAYAFESGPHGFDPHGGVSTSQDTIDLGVGHDLRTGDRVFYDAGLVDGLDAAPVGGLSESTFYYVNVGHGGSQGKVKLYATPEAAKLAAADTEIDLKGNEGTGSSHTLRRAEGDARFFNPENADPSAGVDLLQDTINVGPAHGLETGDKVRYNIDFPGGAPVGNLAVDGEYYVRVVVEDTQKVRLYNNANDAILDRDRIDLVAGATGPAHILTRVQGQLNGFDPQGGASTRDKTIFLGGHDLKPGEAIRYQTGGGEPITGLADENVYFVGIDPESLGSTATPEKKGKITLHLTQADALARVNAIAVDPGSATGTAHQLVPIKYGVQALVEGGNLTAGGDVIISAQEGIHSVADTSWTFNFGDPLIAALTQDSAAIGFASSTTAGITGDGTVSGENVFINGLSKAYTQAKGGTGSTKDSSSSRAIVEGATVIARSGDVDLHAEVETDSLYAALVPMSFKKTDDGSVSVGGNTEMKTANMEMSHTVDAHISAGAAVTAFDDVNVTAFDDPNIVVIADAISVNNEGVMGILAAAVVMADSAVANFTTAYIDGSDVTAQHGDVLVDAYSNVDTLAVGVGVLVAKTSENSAPDFGIAGSLAFTKSKSVVDAHISGDGEVIADGAITVHATYDLTVLTLAAGASIDSEASIGAGVVINQAEDMIRAFIEESDVHASGAVDIEAHYNPDLDSLTAGFALPAEKNPTSTGGKLKDIGKDVAKWGLLAGVLAIISLESTFDVDVPWYAYLAIGIAAAIQILETVSGGVGIGGSTAVNALNSTVDAHISDGADVDSPVAVRVKAIDDPLILTLGGGASIGGDGVSAGAAVTVNEITNKVLAYIEGDSLADITFVDAPVIEVIADENADVDALAVGIAESEDFALGGSFAMNKIANTVDAHISTRAKPVSGLTPGKKYFVSVDGDLVRLHATAAEAASGAGAIDIGIGQTSGVLHSLQRDPFTRVVFNPATAVIGADNTITLPSGHDLATGDEVTYEAGHIAGAANVSATTSILISATDDTLIATLGGAVGINTDKAAGGASISINEIGGAVRAYIEGANVDAPNVSLLAETNADIYSAAMGFALADSFSIGGSFAMNKMTGEVDAHISGDANVSGGTVLVRAVDNTTIFTISGEVLITQDSSSHALGGAVAVNDITKNQRAYAHGAGTSVTAGTIRFLATTNADIATTSAAGQFSQGSSVAASLSFNKMGGSIDAIVGGGAHVGGGAIVEIRATDDAHIIAITGLAGFATSDMGGGSLGAALSNNEINRAVRAAVSGPGSEAIAGTVLVLATSENAEIEGISAGLLGASAFTLGGSVTINTIGGSVTAEVIDGGKVDAAGLARVRAFDDTLIVAISGEVSFNTGDSGAATFGAAVASNTISRTVKAAVTGAEELEAAEDTVVDGNVVEILAQTDGDITVLTIGGNQANSFSLGGSISLNKITQTVSVEATAGAHVTGGSSVTMRAADDANLIALAGFVAFTTGNSGAVIGAALTTNDVADNVTAKVENEATQVNGGTVTIEAGTDSDILSVAVGGTFAQDFNLGGSIAKNTIGNTIDAHVSDSAAVTGSAATIKALDSSDIEADGGAAAIVYSESGGSLGFAIGLSFAFNTITSTVRAYVDSANVTVAGLVEVIAESNGEVHGLAIAGGGNANQGGSGFQFVGAGAVVVNTLTLTVDAYLQDATVTSNGGSITVTASATGDVRADAGGASVNLSTGNSSGLAITLAAAVSENNLTNVVTAESNHSDVTANSGSIAISALSAGEVDSLALGIAGGISAGNSSGVSIVGAGSFSGNNVHNTVTAEVLDGQIAAINISLLAKDTSDIDSDAGAVAIFLARGPPAGFAIGASYARNEIGNTIRAVVDGPPLVDTLHATGSVSIAAESTAKIDALTLAGGLSGSSGNGSAFSFSGAGAWSSNIVSNDVTAEVLADVRVTADAGTVSVSASDSSDIDADAGGASLGAGLTSSGGATITVGAAVAVNEVDNTIRASIIGAPVTAGAGVAVSATSGTVIDAFAIGVAGALTTGNSGAFSFAGAGSSAWNDITNEATAEISTGATITTGGTVSVTAVDSRPSRPTPAPRRSPRQLGLRRGHAFAIGASFSVNDIQNVTRARIADSDIGTAGDRTGNVTVSSTSNSVIDAPRSPGRLGVGRLGWRCRRRRRGRGQLQHDRQHRRGARRGGLGRLRRRPPRRSRRPVRHRRIHDRGRIRHLARVWCRGRHRRHARHGRQQGRQHRPRDHRRLNRRRRRDAHRPRRHRRLDRLARLRRRNVRRTQLWWRGGDPDRRVVREQHRRQLDRSPHQERHGRHRAVGRRRPGRIVHRHHRHGRRAQHRVHRRRRHRRVGRDRRIRRAERHPRLRRARPAPGAHPGGDRELHPRHSRRPGQLDQRPRGLLLVHRRRHRRRRGGRRRELRRRGRGRGRRLGLGQQDLRQDGGGDLRSHHEHGSRSLRRREGPLDGQFHLRRRRARRRPRRVGRRRSARARRRPDDQHRLARGRGTHHELDRHGQRPGSGRRQHHGQDRVDGSGRRRRIRRRDRRRAGDRGRRLGSDQRHREHRRGDDLLEHGERKRGCGLGHRERLLHDRLLLRRPRHRRRRRQRRRRRDRLRHLGLRKPDRERRDRRCGPGVHRPGRDPELDDRLGRLTGRRGHGHRDDERDHQRDDRRGRRRRRGRRWLRPLRLGRRRGIGERDHAHGRGADRQQQRDHCGWPAGPRLGGRFVEHRRGRGRPGRLHRGRRRGRSRDLGRRGDRLQRHRHDRAGDHRSVDHHRRRAGGRPRSVDGADRHGFRQLRRLGVGWLGCRRLTRRRRLRLEEQDRGQRRGLDPGLHRDDPGGPRDHGRGAQRRGHRVGLRRGLARDRRRLRRRRLVRLQPVALDQRDLDPHQGDHRALDRYLGRRPDGPGQDDRRHRRRGAVRRRLRGGRGRWRRSRDDRWRRDAQHDHGVDRGGHPGRRARRPRPLGDRRRLRQGQRRAHVEDRLGRARRPGRGQRRRLRRHLLRSASRTRSTRSAAASAQGRERAGDVLFQQRHGHVVVDRHDRRGCHRRQRRGRRRDRVGRHLRVGGASQQHHDRDRGGRRHRRRGRPVGGARERHRHGRLRDRRERRRRRGGWRPRRVLGRYRLLREPHQRHQVRPRRRRHGHGANGAITVEARRHADDQVPAVALPPRSASAAR